MSIYKDAIAPFGGVIHGSNPCAVAIRRASLAHGRPFDHRQTQAVAMAQRSAANALSKPEARRRVQRERQLKRWSRAKKLALIGNQTLVLKKLSESREPRTGGSRR